jgi:DNA repair exonuclease SbcCD ATPase subunit
MAVSGTLGKRRDRKPSEETERPELSPVEKPTDPPPKRAKRLPIEGDQLVELQNKVETKKREEELQDAMKKQKEELQDAMKKREEELQDAMKKQKEELDAMKKREEELLDAKKRKREMKQKKMKKLEYLKGNFTPIEI